MGAEIEDKAESHSRGAVWRWMVWIGGAMVLYVLSIGPVLRWDDKGPLRSVAIYDKVGAFYSPLAWAYKRTALHKPLGLYYHLWVPERIDKHGDIAVPPK